MPVQHAKSVFKFITCFLAVLLLACILLTAAYTLPTGKIEENLVPTADSLYIEGEYPSILSWCSSGLDNFTDSWMMLLAAEPGNDSPFKAALSSAYSACSASPYSSLVDHYKFGVENEGTYTYQRYWHGYLIFLKPLLSLSDYDGIRLINSALLLFIMVALMLLLILFKKTALILPLGFTILMANPLVIRKSFQYSGCFYIILLACILLLILENRQKLRLWAIHAFLIFGMLTSFFDLLTYPVSTYCVPAAFFMYLLGEKKLGAIFINYVKTGFAWCFGYFGMWLSKWILGSIVLKNNIISNAMNAAKFRTSGEGVISIPETILENLRFFSDTPFIYPVLIFVFAGFAAALFILLKNRGFRGELVSKCILPYSLSLLIPFVWYAVLHNHSAIHAFFTNKALLGSVFSLMLMSSEFIVKFIRTKKSPT